MMKSDVQHYIFDYLKGLDNDISYEIYVFFFYRQKAKKKKKRPEVPQSPDARLS